MHFYDVNVLEIHCKLFTAPIKKLTAPMQTNHDLFHTIFHASYQKVFTDYHEASNLQAF